MSDTASNGNNNNNTNLDSSFNAPLSQAEIRRRRKQEQMEEQLLKEGGDENVTVCVRVRPFNRRELALQAQAEDAGDIRSVIEMPDGINGKVVCLEKDGNEFKVAEEFQFTKSFWSISEEQQPYSYAPVSQFDLYDIVGKPIIKYAMFGFNNCVFAYGQTSSGKTFSMIGSDIRVENGDFTGQPGLVPQLCKGLFDRIQEERLMPEPGLEKTIDVKLSAMEIYNEQVRDLFWRNTPGRTKNSVLKVRVHPVEGAFVDGLTVLEPKNWEQCFRLIEKAISERTVAATLMNDESSRSHSVFQIVVTQKETINLQPDAELMEDLEMRYAKPVSHSKVSRINLVDLAGSERLKKSGAQGQQLKEAAGINQSLSTLKKVIDALVTNGKEPNPKKHIIIPFRESTLTQLLSHSLGGNSKTVMIACVSPHYDNQDETLLTLRYANRTKGIVNHAKVNEDSAAKSALALKHQILELQRKLQEGEGGEEAEDLRDQLDLGKKSLRELEMANKRLEQKQAELIEKTHKEEGARFAAAFYNTVKMVLLQQQKETLVGRIDDVSTRLTEEDSEKKRLRERLEEGTEHYLAQKSAMERMLREEAERRSEESRVDDLCRTLQREYNLVKRKLDDEIGNRWGMRIANARHLEQQRKENEKRIDQIRLDQENRLEDTILDAAEQYERQVKEYADRDTRARHRIAKIEQQLPQLNSKRDVLEEESAAIHQKLRQSEKAHQFRLKEIEEKWRAKYNQMKEEGETNVRAVEDVYHAERLKADAEIDRAKTAAKGRQVADVEKLESDLRLLENQQAGKVAQEATRAAETIAMKAYEQEQAIERNMAETKEKFRQRISYLVKAVRATQAAAEDFEGAQSRLTDQINKYSNSHAKVLAWMTSSSSSETSDGEEWLKTLRTAWLTRGAQVVPIVNDEEAEQQQQRPSSLSSLNKNQNNHQKQQQQQFASSSSNYTTPYTGNKPRSVPTSTILSPETPHRLQSSSKQQQQQLNNSTLNISASTVAAGGANTTTTATDSSSLNHNLSSSSATADDHHHIHHVSPAISKIGISHTIQPQTLRSSTPHRTIAKAALTKNAVSPLRMRGDPLSIPATTNPQFKERTSSPLSFNHNNHNKMMSKTPLRSTRLSNNNAAAASSSSIQCSTTPSATLTPARTRSIIQNDIQRSKREKPMAGSMNFWSGSLRSAATSTADQKKFSIDTSKNVMNQRDRQNDLEYEPLMGKAASNAAKSKDIWSSGLRK